MSRRRIAVTGLGIISPPGNNVASSWGNVRDGVSGITVIDSFDTTGFATSIGGVIKDFDVTDYMSVKDSRKVDKFMHHGIAACTAAFEDSGLEVNENEAHRFGVIMGSGIGGIDTIERNYEKYRNGGPRRISPFFVPSSIGNMVSGHVSIKYGMTGLNLALVTACATSTHCIGLGARLIAMGDADGISRASGQVSNKDNRPFATAFINGKVAPIVGRISMDLITIDVTQIPEAKPGIYAELIGNNISIDDLADISGTIGYEILTRLGQRHHRIYKGLDN